MRLLNILPLALSASAFLVPTEVTGVVQITDKLPASAKTERVVLECDGGCPVALASQALKGIPQRWTQLYPGRLVADVTVEDNKVLFNGKQIWPRTLTPPLSIKQITKDDTFKTPKPFKGLIPVSTSLKYKEAEILVDSATHMTVHPIYIEILALVDQVVHAQSVEVRVVETKDGVGLLPSKIEAYKPSPYTDSCTTVWCRVKGTIAKQIAEWHQAATKKIKGWRGCGQKKAGHRIGGHKQGGHLMNGLPLKGGPNKFGPGSSYNPSRHHGHHGHHHGGARSFILGIFETVIFPAIFGLSIGLIVGAFCSLLINALRRVRSGSEAQYIVVEQVEVEEGLAAPPKYEEVYREPQVEIEDEKKELLQ